MVVQNGKIVAVGPAASVAVPGNATKVDGKGKILMPGLVDSHSHIGSVEGGDSSGAIQPDVRVLDSITSVMPASRKRRPAESPSRT